MKSEHILVFMLVLKFSLLLCTLIPNVQVDVGTIFFLFPSIARVLTLITALPSSDLLFRLVHYLRLLLIFMVMVKLLFALWPNSLLLPL
jgi:hypothetical protein